MFPGRRKTAVAIMRGLAWLAGIDCALWLVWKDIVAAHGRSGLSVNGNALWGRDFANVWTSGRLVIEGQLGTLYNVPAYQAWQAARLGPGILNHNYSYPPLTLFYTPLFGGLPYLVALTLWSLLSAGLFIWAARPWLKNTGWPGLVALVLPSTLVCLWAGHYGLIIGALMLGAWQNLERRPKLAGVLTGLIIIKPHLAVLMPLMLLKRRAWTPMVWAALTVAVLVALSVAVFGPDLWREYLTRTSGEQLRMVAYKKAFFIKMMPTITPALLHYGVSTALAWTIQIGAGLAAAAALWRFQPADPKRAALATATATFLILPYAFNYDMTLIGLAAAVLIFRKDAPAHLWRTGVAACALVLPAALLFLNREGIWIAPLVLAALLGLLLMTQADDNIREMP